MSEPGWSREGWGAGEREERSALPRVDELPSAPDGYDREAVRAAFDAFYRHAAQLDATLRTLESVEAFRREAAQLRSDIRSLRAASWAPAGSRDAHPYAYAYAPRTFERVAGRGQALPRLALEAIFIVLIAVGAAVANFSTLWIVLLVLGSWLIVGLAEIVGAAARPRVRSLPPLDAPRPVVAEPAPEAAAPEPEQKPAPAAEAPAAALAQAPPPGAATTPASPQPRPRFWRRGRTDAARPADEGPAATPSAHVRVIPSDPGRPGDPWERGPELPSTDDAVPRPEQPLAEPAAAAEGRSADEPVPSEDTEDIGGAEPAVSDEPAPAPAAAAVPAQQRALPPLLRRGRR